MSEPTPEPRSAPPTGDNVVSAPAASSTPAPAAEPPVQTGLAVPPGPAGVQPVEADVPQLPQLPRCPRCNVGYLYVSASDESAAHEAGQRLYAPFFKSGGSVTRRCLNCEWQDNVALNPTTAPVNPLPEG